MLDERKDFEREEKKESELFRISRMNRMKARVWVSEKDVLEVKRGLPAYAIWNNKHFSVPTSMSFEELHAWWSKAKDED